MTKFADILSWIASFIIIAGGYYTAMDVVPLNKIVLFIGSLLFVYIGVQWKKSSVWSLNLLMVCVYGYGLYRDFI